MIKIDGDIIAGKGQVMRIALALSAVLKKPVHLVNFLKDRAKIGLGHQHLTGLQLLKEVTQALVKGDTLGSINVTFEPQAIVCGNYTADAKTAGSVTLMLQCSLPCLIFGDHNSVLHLKGGTNVYMAPQIDYIIKVLQPMVQKFGVHFQCNIIRRGFCPAGQGHIEVAIPGSVKELKPVNLVDFGEIEKIEGEAFVAGVLPLKKAEAMAEAAKSLLLQSTNAKISIKVTKFSQKNSYGNGAGIILVAVTTTGCYLGGSFLGSRDVTDLEAGQKAAEEVLNSLNRKACVDEHLQDQLIIFMALANGKSYIKTGPLTSHAENAIRVTEMMSSARFSIKKLDNGCNIIECTGQGMK